MKLGLPPCGIRSATSTTIDFGANCPFTFVPAYCLPVYASQSPLPDTTQDSVRGYRLSFTAVAISGDMVSCAFKGSVALSGAACPGRSGTPALTLPRISSMTTARAFRGFRFPAEVILWAVRWYLQFPISYRDLEAMLADRGVAVDHTTMYRWVQRFAPELEKRMRRHLRPCRGPWHVDETYIRVNGQWRYLYRAVDGTGQTIDFLLSAKRDKKAA